MDNFIIPITFFSLLFALVSLARALAWSEMLHKHKGE